MSRPQGEGNTSDLNQSSSFFELQRVFVLRQLWKKRHRRLWCSPYVRARETADQIMDVAKDYITDRREHILLGEQQFGLLYVQFVCLPD